MNIEEWKAKKERGKIKNRTVPFSICPLSDVVLLDERDARRAAMRMGLKVLGTVGILLWGKKAGKLVSLREQLDALRFQGKFRISQRLYERVLREAGE